MASREEMAWAGGLFEGEGCVTIGKGGKGVPHVSLRMTDADIVLRFTELMGCGRTYGPYHRDNPNHQSVYQWQTTSFEQSQAAIAKLWEWLGPRRRGRIVEVLTLYRDAPVERHRAHARYSMVTPGISRQERQKLNNAAYVERHKEETRQKRRLAHAIQRDDGLVRDELIALGRPAPRRSRGPAKYWRTEVVAS